MILQGKAFFNVKEVPPLHPSQENFFGKESMFGRTFAAGASPVSCWLPASNGRENRAAGSSPATVN